jgi:hypothetical protein
MGYVTPYPSLRLSSFLFLPIKIVSFVYFVKGSKVILPIHGIREAAP